MIYKYKALFSDGKEIRGQIDARDKSHAALKIRELGYRPVKISEANLLNKDIVLFSKAFNDKNLHIFLYQLYILLKSKIPIDQAVSLLKDSYSNKRQKIIADIHKEIISGENLSKGMDVSGSFPKLVTNMVEVGENSSNLPEVLNNLSKFYKNKVIFEQKIKNALIYPIILIIVTFLILNFLVFNVLPSFEEVFRDSSMQLPFLTRILLGFSRFVRDNFFIVSSIFIAIILALIVYFNSNKGKSFIEKLKLKFDLYRIFLISNFVNMMRFLLKSNLTTARAIEIIADSNENESLNKDLQKVRQDIYEGLSLSESLKSSKIFSDFDISMIKTGEESSNILEIMDSISEYYEYKLELKQEKFISYFEPIMILILAVIVGFIVISIAMPMFDLINTI